MDRHSSACLRCSSQRLTKNQIFTLVNPFLSLSLPHNNGELWRPTRWLVHSSQVVSLYLSLSPLRIIDIALLIPPFILALPPTVLSPPRTTPLFNSTLAMSTLRVVWPVPLPPMLLAVTFVATLKLTTASTVLLPRMAVSVDKLIWREGRNTYPLLS